VLEHGGPGFPGALHLALNAFLILECGRPAERLLGHARFLALGSLAILANAVAQVYTGGVNGSSLVIWSWGPVLFLALRWARKADPAVTASGAYRRIRGILVLMYGIVVFVMGFLPYLSGARLNPLASLVLGNRYHLVATGVGILFALVSAGFLRSRLRALGDPAGDPA
jgi:membrane associated rhomboid family serine protease